MSLPFAISLVTDVLDALSVISILIIVALGLGVILGLMGVINLAHGAFIALGAYTTYAVVSSGASFWLALLVAPAAGLLLGLLIERSVVRFLYHRPLDTVLATWGLALIITQGLELIFGSRPKSVNPPLDGQLDLLGVTYPSFRLFSIVAATALCVVALLWLYRTEFGLQIRAIIQDRDIASAVGIHTGRVNAIAFAVGAAFAAFAGVLLTGQGNLTPAIGLPYLAPAFLVVLVGGQGSIPGLIGAAVLLGATHEAFTEAITPAVAQAGMLTVAVCLARLRPTGLFGVAR